MHRAATRDLTRLGLVLAPGAVRGRWLARVALIVAGALAGAGAMHLLDVASQRATPLLAAATAAGPSPVQQQLDQSRLTLRLAESRSQELEHQIATLVRQLRDSQEELTFFKKTRDGKSSSPR